MSQQHNLLVEPCITTANKGIYTLPGTLGALARDEIDSFTALRPHQAMFWHMFCVQLGALALHRAGVEDIPEDEDIWRKLLRGLTPDYPDDEPWSLIVDDRSKPAFLQSPVPEGIELQSEIATPDALDLLITSRNHDLKQKVARLGSVEDWTFALVSLQTGEGYNGRGNYGIARMNGGSSSRSMLSLAPLHGERSMNIRPGLRFRREVGILLQARSSDAWDSDLGFDKTNGKALLWVYPWLCKSQFQLRDLDPLFVEVCRRVRLNSSGGIMSATSGKSNATRIDAVSLKGAVGDPWAPVHKVENKSFTLGTNGDFDYKKTVDLLFSGDWTLPILGQFDERCDQGTLAVMLSALSRGNSKTEGLKSRIIPLSGKISRGLGPSQKKLHDLAKQQVETIDCFEKALKKALVLVAARGEHSSIKRELNDYTVNPAKSLGRYADEIFFPHLWARFDAQEAGPEMLRLEEIAFAKKLWKRTQIIFETALPTMPCPSLFRPRAEACARRALRSKALRDRFPEVLYPSDSNEKATVNAG